MKYFEVEEDPLKRWKVWTWSQYGDKGFTIAAFGKLFMFWIKRP